MEKTVSYSLAVKGIGGGAVIYPHKIGVLETAKSRSLDLSTISGLLKKINFSVFTNLPSLLYITVKMYPCSGGTDTGSPEL